MSVLSKMIEPKMQIPEERKRFDNQFLVQMTIPIIIELFLTFFVGIADSMMVSYAGEAAVSGVSLVNQLNTLFIMIFIAIASGGAVVVSQYIGSKQREKGIWASGQLLMVTTLIAVICAIGANLFAAGIFSLIFGKVESDVMAAGVIYLKISALSYPFLGIQNACSNLYRSMGKTKILMNISIVSNLINLVGNAIGIFVLHAGVLGVAYPTLIARIFSALVLLVLMQNRENEIYVTAKGIFSWNGDMIRKIFHIAIPNTVENGLFQFTKIALSSIVAMFGTSQIAANGVAQTLWSMSAVFNNAMGPVFITVIGQCIGAGDKEAADYYMKKLLRITTIGSLSWNVVFILLGPAILHLYNLEAQTIQLVWILLLIHNISNGFLCPSAFVMSSGIRAAGDAKYTMYASIVTSVVGRVAFSVFFAIVLNMGVIGIALAMVCDWGLKAVLIQHRYRSGKWKDKKVI